MQATALLMVGLTVWPFLVLRDLLRVYTLFKTSIWCKLAYAKKPPNGPDPEE